MRTDLETFTDKKIINYYENYSDAQKPEITILQSLNKLLANMSMLDIGIGGGRTTKLFSESVKNYVGVDFSKGMVDACIRKFESEPSLEFRVADVRNLSEFEENTFDFVLFSFNGIDTLSEQERFLALNEMKRVLKPKGYLCFSTHNILSIDTMLIASFRKNILAMIKRYLDIKKIKKINEQSLNDWKSKNFVRINDGAHNFSLINFYIRPTYQIQNLVDLNFENIKLFSLTSGKMLSENLVNTCNDKWIYFLCQKA